MRHVVAVRFSIMRLTKNMGVVKLSASKKDLRQRTIYAEAVSSMTPPRVLPQATYQPNNLTIMKKIKTIFERDWNGSGGILPKYIEGFDPAILSDAIATEKLDGTNVRITVRNNGMVRLEKRRNPTKLEKAKGIEEPWYVDADEYAPNDKYMWEAARATDLSDIADGEWSGEVLGPDIQGNPLNLESNRVVLFSCGKAPVFENVPTTYEELKEWLKAQKSKYGRDCGIEGVVWHCADGSMFKIKNKDFKP